MKKITLTLLLILVSIGLFSQATVGTQVTSGVVPNDSLDNYPSHFAYFGKGGLRTVSDTTERNNILTSRREQGMMVYVEDMGKYYILKDSTGNGAWTEFNTATFEEWDTIAFGDETDVYRYSQRYDTIPIIDLDSISIELDELGITVYQANDSICLDSVVSISKNLYVNGDLVLPGGSSIIIGDSSVNLNLDHIPANAYIYKIGDSLNGSTDVTRTANGLLIAANKYLWLSSGYISSDGSSMTFKQGNAYMQLINTGGLMALGGLSVSNACAINESVTHTNPTISPHYGIYNRNTGFGGYYTSTDYGCDVSAIVESHEEMRWEYDTTRVYSQLFQINDELGFDDGNTVSAIVSTGDTLATAEWTKAQINDTADAVRGEIAAIEAGEVDTSGTPAANQIAYFETSTKIAGSNKYKINDDVLTINNLAENDTGLVINTTTERSGLFINNSSEAAGYRIVNSSGGNGGEILNESGGIGFSIANSGLLGIGFYIQNNILGEYGLQIVDYSESDAINVNSIYHGNIFVGQDDGVDVFVIDSAGNTDITGDLTVSGDLTATKINNNSPHLYAGFADSSTVIACTDDTWAHISNSGDSLFRYIEVDEFTVLDDTITIQDAGDYEIYFNLSFSGNNGEDWKIRTVKLSGATETTVGFNSERYTSNNDIGNVSNNVYGEFLAGDKIYFQIMNTTDSDDATVKSASVLIKYLHE